MSDIAINDKGDVLAFDGKEWKPAPIAENDKGERLAFANGEWRPLPKPEKGFVEKAAGVVNETVNTLGTQFTKGITGALGVPDTLGQLGERGAAWAGEKLGAPDLGRNIGAAIKNQITWGGVMPSTEGMNKAIFEKMGVPEVNLADNPALTLTNPLGIEGKVNLGKMIDTGLQAIPTAALGAGPAVAKALPAFTAGVTSEAAGQATADSPWEIPARLAGGFLGYKGGQRVVTPLPANLTPEQARMVELAKEKGVPLSVGQETGRGRGLESALARFPTSQGRMADFADDQNTAINRLALKTAGAEGDRLDPTTMNRVMKQASSEFEAAKQTSGNIKLDTDFFRDLNKTITNYLDNTPAAAQTPSVTKRAGDFLSAPGRQLSGEQYQEFRRTLNEAAQSVSDVGAKRALQGMRNALDDAMAASLPADQRQAWNAVRRNWANLKILTKAAAGGTVDSRAAGNLSPSALSMALRQRQGADRFSSTEGGMNDIARLASYLADTRPNSGTPQTLLMQSMMTGGPIAGGAMAGGAPGAALAAGAMAAPNLMARSMTGSGWTPIAQMVRNYLANQAVDPRLLNVESVPFALAPGVVTMPRLESRQ